MPLQSFIDNSLPTIKAAWLNAIDAFYFTLFNSATTAAQARTALGSTTAGDAVFIAASTAAARTAIDAASLTTSETITGAKTFNSGTTTPLTLEYSNDGAGTGPIATLSRISNTAVAGDNLGAVHFVGKDSLFNDTTYAEILGEIETALDTAEDGNLYLRTMVAGTLTTHVSVKPTALVIDRNTFIGDTTNTNATLGLTINQGGADDEILALKSSDVAHGITDLAETDTFGTLTKAGVSTGGLYVKGYSSGTVGLFLKGVHTTDDTTKTTGGIGAVTLHGSLKSAANEADLGANANILAVRNRTTTRFILDADGDSHQDVGTAWTNFDAHQDVELLTALSVHVSGEGDPIRSSFASFLVFNRQRLQDLKLVTFNEDGHHFVNMSKLTMLLTGAVRQMSSRIDAIEQKLLSLT